jgi:hypothetical protein
MRVRLRLVCCALTLLGTGGAATAHAAATPPTPKSFVVASDGDTQLVARDDDDQLCVGIRTKTGDSESCDASAFGVANVGGEPDGARYVGVATPAAAATVEVRRAGNLVASARTVAGEAYTGKRAGTVRFAIVPLPAGTPVDGLRVRSLDATGALVAVASTDPDGDLVSDRHRLRSGRSGSVRWSLTANRTSTLTPSVLDLGHESVTSCIEARVSAHGSSSTSTTCAGLAPRDSLEIFGPGLAVSAEDRCDPQFRLMHGVVDVAVQRVSFTLGDGSRRAARITPFGDGQHVLYAIVLPRAAAVRSVRYDSVPGGSRVVRLGLAPLAVTCASGDDDLGLPLGSALLSPFSSPFANLPAVTPVGPVTTLPGDPPIRVADGPGDSLCLAIGDRPFTVLSCSVVSPLFSELLGAFDDITAPKAFGIVVPAQVAAVRVGSLDGKVVRTIPTVPGTGYDGPYAGHVRFASATVGATSELNTIDLLDAAGTVLYHERDSPDDTDVSPPTVVSMRRVAGRSGQPSLWQTALRDDGSIERCLALTKGARPTRDGACETTRSAANILLDASCASHRLTVAVAVSAGTRVLADTGRAHARAIALHAGAGLLTLPSSRPLRSLTFVRDGKRTRVRLDAAPGARQCGWSLAPQVTLGVRTPPAGATS